MTLKRSCRCYWWYWCPFWVPFLLWPSSLLVSEDSPAQSGKYSITQSLCKNEYYRFPKDSEFREMNFFNDIFCFPKLLKRNFWVNTKKWKSISYQRIVLAERPSKKSIDWKKCLLEKLWVENCLFLILHHLWCNPMFWNPKIEIEFFLLIECKIDRLQNQSLFIEVAKNAFSFNSKAKHIHINFNFIHTGIHSIT